MDNYYAIKKNGKYAVMKQNGKRAVRLFTSEQEALDYISQKGTVGEATPVESVDTDQPTATIDLGVSQPDTCCSGNCKCKKPSLLSRILNLFKKS